MICFHDDGWMDVVKVCADADQLMHQYPWLKRGANYEFWCEVCHANKTLAPQDKLSMLKEVLIVFD